MTDPRVAAIRARHRRIDEPEVKGQPPYSWCPGCRTSWPCDAAVLLDALGEVERELNTLYTEVCEGKTGKAWGPAYRWGIQDAIRRVRAQAEAAGG